MQDPSLLEFAWSELLEKNKSVTVEEMAEVITPSGLDVKVCFYILTRNACFADNFWQC